MRSCACRPSETRFADLMGDVANCETRQVFFPKISSFCDPRSNLSRGGGFGDGSGRGRPTGKKGKSFFSLSRKNR